MRQRLSHFIRLLCIASFCILVTGCINTTENSSSPSTPKSASTTTSDNFSTLLDSIWTYEQCGSSDEENASKIPNIAPAKLAADAAQYQTYIDTLQAFDVNSLSHEEQITHTIQLYRLQN
ncbi:MAG: DUF885 domain-containing protein, partial [Glaciecola sp.]|nr:DUF885 domain-containing protein [Glaciecola sp.]